MSILVGGLAAANDVALAQNAGDVMNKMNHDQRTGYLAGVIEGLAYARWQRDAPDATGMNCIYDWFYDGGIENQRAIDNWFGRHPDKQAGPLLYILYKDECGE